MNPAGNSKHLSPLLEGVMRGDQRAAPDTGLHHNDSQTQPADDPVPSRKMQPQRRRAQRELAHDRPLGSHLVRQLPVFRRVDLVQPAPQNRQRSATRLQSAPVGRRVDAARQAAHDRQAPAGQRASELAGHRLAIAGGMSGPHDGNRCIITGFQRPLEVEDRRRRGDFLQARGVGRVPPDNHAHPSLGDPRLIFPKDTRAGEAPHGLRHPWTNPPHGEQRLGPGLPGPDRGAKGREKPLQAYATQLGKQPKGPACLPLSPFHNRDPLHPPGSGYGWTWRLRTTRSPD